MVSTIFRDECLWESIADFWSVFKNMCLGIWCTCFSLCKLTWEFLSILIHEILTKIYQSEDSVNSHGSYGDGFPGSSSYL